MDGNCLSECLIYKASVSTTTNKYYYGTCENTFKERYNNHKCSFRNKSREKNTELSKYVWELKEKDINYFINWDIAMKVQKYSCGSQKCDLCICEKLLIARADPNALLNKHDDLVSKCHHRNKFTLMCFKDRQDNLYYLVYVIILAFLSRYKYCRKPSDDWRHETQCNSYLLLLITFYIHHIALFHIILSTLPEIVNNL